MNQTWQQFFDVLLLILKPEDVFTVGLKSTESEIAAGLARRLLGMTDTALKANNTINI